MPISSFCFRRFDDDLVTGRFDGVPADVDTAPDEQGSTLESLLSLPF